MDPTPILLETTVLVDTFLINSFGFETPRVRMDMFWNHTFGSEIGEGFKEDEGRTGEISLSECSYRKKFSCHLKFFMQ